MKTWLPALRMKIVMTIMLGLIYPLAMTAIAQIAFPRQASGDFVQRGGATVGSMWIAQKFEQPKYFWSRPSAVDYNPLPSGGSNLGPTSADLLKAVSERRQKLMAANSSDGEPPQDLLFASASGLDPHLSPKAAHYQVSRVAQARGLDALQIHKLVEDSIELPQFGLLGEATVNVLALNMALDKIQGIEAAPVPREEHVK